MNYPNRRQPNCRINTGMNPIPQRNNRKEIYRVDPKVTIPRY